MGSPLRLGERVERPAASAVQARIEAADRMDVASYWSRRIEAIRSSGPRPRRSLNLGDPNDHDAADFQRIAVQDGGAVPPKAIQTAVSVVRQATAM